MRPWLTTLIATVLAALVTWVAVSLDVVVDPRVDEVAPVDAAYVIGPVETRIEEALAVMDTGVAPVLLATTSVNADTGEHYATDHCRLRTATYRVECVLPEPYTTRGEARVLGARVAEHGWDRVAVMTSTPHAARTRMLMERCTDATCSSGRPTPARTGACGAGRRPWSTSRAPGSRPSSCAAADTGPAAPVPPPPHGGRLLR
ncbi:hypothetical protein BJF81_12850 [Ornithinimicrobium sp. CNJ-824]|uniref:hypothetical protein n=1 Tax=Ornithinimicrobium sp. CNJ-824 TaxID=1904966 RepID=UPI0009634DE6|nr:hypothetical protein [Ornithinimicrobium sp. CNJ-824]OLT22778.1 hypothetical protein BJF81_12850 [Ornithinimicrobium sp. CNJ-824]